jgi:biopolymer transport protein ExbD
MGSLSHLCHPWASLTPIIASFVPLAVLGCAAGPVPATECPACPACLAPAVATSSSLAQAALSRQSAVPVSFPSAEDWNAQQVLVIALKATGEVRVNGNVFAEQELETIVRSARQKDSELRVLIQADRSATWEQVVRVMEQVKRQGVVRISFGVSALAP